MYTEFGVLSSISIFPCYTIIWVFVSMRMVSVRVFVCVCHASVVHQLPLILQATDNVPVFLVISSECPIKYSLETHLLCVTISLSTYIQHRLHPYHTSTLRIMNIFVICSLNQFKWLLIE